MTTDSGEEKPTEPPAPEPKPKPEKPKAPESQGKGKKVAVLVILLVIFVGLVIALAVFGGDLLGSMRGGAPPLGGIDIPGEVSMVEVGTPGAAATLTKEGAEDTAQDVVQEDEVGYVYCEQLGPGDKVATMGDDDKYDITGPVWFTFVDEEPDAWFEHDVKYIFIDASTGEKTVYEESWPPDINGEDMFEAADDCGGLTEVYKS